MALKGDLGDKPAAKDKPKPRAMSAALRALVKAIESGDDDTAESAFRTALALADDED